MTGIRRACTYSVGIKTPEPPVNYSRLIVTFAQDQEILISKELSELEVSEDGVLVVLTQNETAMFRPSEKSPMGRREGRKAVMQVRAYKGQTDAPGSKCWWIDVHDSLNQEVISGA